MLGPEPRMSQPGGFLLGEDHGLPGLRGEPREHHEPPRPRSRRRVYFLWTLCLLTPRCSAISCQLHPWALALPTCRASRLSRSRRRAATARNPVAGSLLPAAVASLVASLIARQLRLTVARLSTMADRRAVLHALLAHDLVAQVQAFRS